MRSQPNPLKYSSKEWAKVSDYDMAHGQSIELDLRENNSTLPCRKYFKSAFFRFRRAAVNFPNPDTVWDWRWERTENPAITRLGTTPMKKKKH